MDRFDYAFQTLTQLREEVGTAIFDHAMKSFNRQRLDNGAGREKRKRFPWSKYQNLYRKKNGICWWCQNDMKLLMREIQLDHFDPNAENFNADENLSVIHNRCNQEKGAKTLVEQAEYLHITIKELIERFQI